MPPKNAALLFAALPARSARGARQGAQAKAQGKRAGGFLCLSSTRPLMRPPGFPQIRRGARAGPYQPRKGGWPLTAVFTLPPLVQTRCFFRARGGWDNSPGVNIQKGPTPACARGRARFCVVRATGARPYHSNASGTAMVCAPSVDRAAWACQDSPP
jgi:hypothetical protein